MTEKFPLMLPSIVIEEENEELYGFEILAEDRTGLLYDIAKIFEDHGVYIKKFTHSDRRNKRLLLFLVFDVKGKGREILEPIREKLLTVKNILKVDEAPKYGSIVYTNKLAPITTLGYRSIVFGSANMIGLTKGLREHVGPDVANLILVSLGKMVGEKLYEIYEPIYKLTTVTSMIEFLRTIVAGTGWGTIEDVKISNNKITLVFRDLWECDLLGKMDEKPIASYSRGILIGFFTRGFKRHADVEQVYFKKKKDGSLCVFEIVRT